MDYVLHSHRGARELMENTPHLRILWEEIQASLRDVDVTPMVTGARKGNSISDDLHKAVRDQLLSRGWAHEVPFYAPSSAVAAVPGALRAEFSKPMSVATGRTSGVVLNFETGNGPAGQWALMNATLAIELSPDVNPIGAGPDGVGVVVSVTQDLRKRGFIDSSVTTHEKLVTLLAPLRSKLTSPLLLVGLQAPPVEPSEA